jgi:hypothetical protein
MRARIEYLLVAALCALLTFTVYRCATASAVG